ncbi:MAG: sigma-54-dependent Fis family transcriptional regulator [Deltaproteobacteria bacterium]|nr:sigma-54-dependent Fis family transcriptional regulator [Deltaproteobacteria bacterium]
MLFTEGDAALEMTASVVQTGASAFVAAPLIAHGASFGVIAGWSPLGPAALPASALPQLAVAASIVALSASQLAVRAEGEVERRRLEDENTRLRGAATGLRVVEPVGESRAFTEALTLARSVASSDVPVLLNGETGSGKEVLARNVHLWSRRAAKPFVAFNCAAVPESLIESELFGHVRGAFTGAGADRKGLFEEADGGTIFLDEIGEMPGVMQAKLLRVLQDGEVRRVGASRPLRVDVRVVSATHRDLARLVTEGRFRADLMYRLNAVTLRIPSLRERGDDVSLLAHFLLGRAADSARKRIPGFAADALWALSRYDFPGNVRELENEILRAVALTPEGEPIRASVFSERVAGQAPPPGATQAPDGQPVTLKDAVAATERAVVEAAIARHGGNVSQAARELDLTRPGLYKVMERLGLR